MAEEIRVTDWIVDTRRNRMAVVEQAIGNPISGYWIRYLTGDRGVCHMKDMRRATDVEIAAGKADRAEVERANSLFDPDKLSKLREQM